MIRKILTILAGTLAATSAAHAADDYPRLAPYAIGGAQDYYNATYQQKLAKVDVAGMAGYPVRGSRSRPRPAPRARRTRGRTRNVRGLAQLTGKAWRSRPAGP